MRKFNNCSYCSDQYTCDQDDTMIRPDCFKKIPKGFEFDHKHREWIDTRCNNSKLKKLHKKSVRVDVKLKKEKNSMVPTPAICIAPFNTVQDEPNHPELLKTRVDTGANIDINIKKTPSWNRYPHIPILSMNPKVKRSLLGLRLMWTIKHDGENVTIWKRNKKYRKRMTEIVISSHNQEIAAKDIQSRVKISCMQDYVKILALINDNPTFRIVVEECARGTSITGIRRYSRATLYILDIFDTSINNFLPYTLVHQYCFHYNIPIAELYAVTRHRTLRDLNKFSNQVLEYCNTEKEYGKDEGMVIKSFNKNKEYIMAKCKLDIPRPIVERIRNGPIRLPQIPDNEIMGAIDHAYQELGNKKFQEVKLAMPLIAKMVSEECRKHLYSSKANLFSYYKQFMENYVNQKENTS